MSWDSVDENRPESGSWGKLQEGVNILRIVSEPAGFRKHYNPVTKKSVICTSTKIQLCDICKMNKKPSSRFIVNAFELVLDKAGKIIEKNLKHYEFPYSIISNLEGFRIDPEYKFESVPDWDMRISKKTGNEPKDVKYQVTPSRKNRELSNEEKEAMKDFPTPDDMIVKKLEYEGVQPVEETPIDLTESATSGNSDVLPPDNMPDPEGQEEIDIDNIPF